MGLAILLRERRIIMPNSELLIDPNYTAEEENEACKSILVELINDNHISKSQSLSAIVNNFNIQVLGSWLHKGGLRDNAEEIIGLAKGVKKTTDTPMLMDLSRPTNAPTIGDNTIQALSGDEVSDNLVLWPSDFGLYPKDTVQKIPKGLMKKEYDLEYIDYDDLVKNTRIVRGVEAISIFLLNPHGRVQIPELKNEKSHWLKSLLSVWLYDQSVPLMADDIKPPPSKYFFPVSRSYLTGQLPLKQNLEIEEGGYCDEFKIDFYLSNTDDSILMALMGMHAQQNGTELPALIKENLTDYAHIYFKPTDLAYMVFGKTGGKGDAVISAISELSKRVDTIPYTNSLGEDREKIIQLIQSDLSKDKSKNTPQKVSINRLLIYTKGKSFQYMPENHAEKKRLAKKELMQDLGIWKKGSRATPQDAESRILSEVLTAHSEAKPERYVENLYKSAGIPHPKNSKEHKKAFTRLISALFFCVKYGALEGVYDKDDKVITSLTPDYIESYSPKKGPILKDRFSYMGGSRNQKMGVKLKYKDKFPWVTAGKYKDISG